jgi:hypothetical protein
MTSSISSDADREISRADCSPTLSSLAGGSRGGRYGGVAWGFEKEVQGGLRAANSVCAYVY